MVKWFQVLQANTNSFICTQLNGFKYGKWLNSFISSIDATLTGTITRGQCEPGSCGNEGVLHILQKSGTGALPPDGLMSYPEQSLSLYKDTVGVFF